MRIHYFSDIRFPLERANGIQTMETCHALAERGHAVILGVRPDTAPTARDPFAFYGLDPLSNLRIERARVIGPGVARRGQYLAFAIHRAVGRDAADAILTRDLGVASALLHLPPRLRPPVAHESHGFAAVFADTMDELVSGGRRAGAAKQRRLLAREARVWRLADAYVTTTRSLATELEARFGARPLVAVVPNGVRLPAERRFDPPEPQPNPVLVYAGHLYPWKGVDLLVGAIARLPDVCAVVVGGHPAETDLDRLRRLSERLGVQNRIEFTGLVARAEVPALLARASVLVLPTTSTPSASRYTSPLKMFEYLAVGKPIVASDLSAIREILVDGDNAVLVKPSDEDALVGGIRRVLDDRPLATRIASAAFDQAEAYSWDRRAERIETLLRAVVLTAREP